MADVADEVTRGREPGDPPDRGDQRRGRRDADGGGRSSAAGSLHSQGRSKISQSSPTLTSRVRAGRTSTAVQPAVLAGDPLLVSGLAHVYLPAGAHLPQPEGPVSVSLSLTPARVWPRHGAASGDYRGAAWRGGASAICGSAGKIGEVSSRTSRPPRKVAAAMTIPAATRITSLRTYWPSSVGA